MNDLFVQLNVSSFIGFSRFLIFWVYGCGFFFFCDDSDKGQWIQGLSNQRNDWILAKSTLMYCDLSDLGSLILVQIIPKK